MSLPDRVHFRITTPLSAETVLQRLRDSTFVPYGRNRGKRIYFGRFQDDRFELTRRLDRGEYKSTLPAAPLVAPKSILFMQGRVTPDENGTAVDITIDPNSAIASRWRDMFMVGVVLPVVFLLLFVPTFLLLFSMLGTPVTLDPDKIRSLLLSRQSFQGIGRWIGAWVGVGATWIGFTLFDTQRYKSRFQAIVTLEENALTQLLR